jgi:tRNA pseudouridine55 synthase
MNSEGILLINKASGQTSFSLISLLRRITKIKKIGHCGTLDPLARGVMILLIGKNYTQKSNLLLMQDKEYVAEITLGKISSTYDNEGVLSSFSCVIPSIDELKKALLLFQGTILQTPPMFCAKKIMGQRLYKLARKGITVERSPIKVTIQTTLLSYEYPIVKLHITCGKGTYIRSLAHDLGQALGSGGFLSSLIRTRHGPFIIDDCLNHEMLANENFDLTPFIRKDFPC